MISSQVASPYGFVGQSLQIRRVRELVEKVKRSRSPVLILGESGTGKEVVARALHNASACGEFVPVDCGSLGGPLMVCVLFGFSCGVFSGVFVFLCGLFVLAV